MIVVSNTSPLNYLVLVELHSLLPDLFSRVLIPPAVERELRAPGAPLAIRKFLASAPQWLAVERPVDMDPQLQPLDAGEREAIALAVHLSADLVLLDERRGREVARERGLAVSGTLGVIDLADRRGLVRVADALERLKTTNFRVSPRVLSRFGGAGGS